MEDVVVKVMQVDKAVELFHTMVIVNLNMGNLNLEVSNLNNRLATEAKEKAILQVELDKERDFQKEYKHNIEIWTKNRTEND
jgi:regulator of replication initiation timing